jgi:hypothetical protein
LDGQGLEQFKTRVRQIVQDRAAQPVR